MPERGNTPGMMAGMQSLLVWMSEPWEGPLPFNPQLERPKGVPEQPTRLQVYAALVGLNGSTKVQQWGYITSGGPYDRRGLEQDEALALIEVASYVDGWLYCMSGVEAPTLKNLVHAEWDRVRAL